MKISDIKQIIECIRLELYKHSRNKFTKINRGEHKEEEIEIISRLNDKKREQDGDQ